MKIFELFPELLTEPYGSMYESNELLKEYGEQFVEDMALVALKKMAALVGGFHYFWALEEEPLAFDGWKTVFKFMTFRQIYCALFTIFNSEAIINGFPCICPKNAAEFLRVSKTGHQYLPLDPKCYIQIPKDHPTTEEDLERNKRALLKMKEMLKGVKG